MRTRYKALVVAVGVAVIGRDVQAQQEFPQTLYWGAGLIDIPAAWVAPITGDFAINYSGKQFKIDPSRPKINYNDKLNSQLTFSMSFAGRVEAGVAAFSSNPEWGFFGQGLVVRQEDFKPKGGAMAWIPSVAVGVRNVGPYDKVDRFGVGYTLLPPTTQNEVDYVHVADSLHRNFQTNNTFYLVGTESFSIADFRSTWPDINLSVTAGYGNGLFSDDGELGGEYSSRSTGGFFWGVKSDVEPTRNTVLSLMLEHNAWDFNIGGSLMYRGIRAGLYATELGATKNPTSSAAGTYYNYPKVAFTIGWQSNVYALLRGEFLQSREAELQRRRQALVGEITKRQQRIAALELEINRYEAQNLLELEQRRQQAEAELRTEREALQRLEERLKRVEQQAPPPTTRPPQR
jgi:hypothetical protein